MGYVRVKVGIYNPGNPERVIEVDGLVDTGAVTRWFVGTYLRGWA
ncbi:hypothetical protein [Vulcanisaeta thermophila]|nr:hypothetical protein [Vulcanisaeta thermophila]